MRGSNTFDAIRSAGVGHGSTPPAAASKPPRKAVTATTSASGSGESLTRLTKAASGLTSIPTDTRPCWAAPTMIDPDPQNGSRIRWPSPSSVINAGENPSRYRNHRWIGCVAAPPSARGPPGPDGPAPPDRPRRTRGGRSPRLTLPSGPASQRAFGSGAVACVVTSLGWGLLGGRDEQVALLIRWRSLGCGGRSGRPAAGAARRAGRERGPGGRPRHRLRLPGRARHAAGRRDPVLVHQRQPGRGPRDVALPDQRRSERVVRPDPGRGRSPGEPEAKLRRRLRLRRR